ncbi:MAG TPA: hypothetical protein VEB69_16740, partial [Acidimicrobiia bacterium]|nr:hypothetical protein [Acidimicrobiia bacterium]
MAIWQEAQTDVLDRVMPDVPAAPRKVRDGGPLGLDDVRVIPSFLERLRHTTEEGWDLHDPEIARVLPASEAAAFSLAHRVEIEDAMDYL